VAELRIRLDLEDFRALVAGGVVERDGAKIILADVGYDAMLKGIADAVDRVQPAPPQHFVSASCGGERCSVCGRAATHKLEETIFHDDPMPHRHPLVAYVCCIHFREAVGYCTFREVVGSGT
jgi:hypothetical protein